MAVCIRSGNRMSTILVLASSRSSAQQLGLLVSGKELGLFTIRRVSFEVELLCLGPRAR